MDDNIRTQRVQVAYDSGADPPGAARNEYRMIL
jgi:hypothetical protein